MNWYYSYLFPLAFSAISSLTIVRLDWPKPFKLFCVFLVTTFAVETMALSWSYGLHKSPWWDYSANNIWLYNIYLIPQYTFYIYFFSANTHSLFLRRIAVGLAIIYVFVACLNFFYRRNLFVVDGGTIILANIIIIFFSIAYFNRLMKAKTVTKLSRQPMFWIATGAFIFHLGTLPCFMLYKYIATEDKVLATSLFRIIVILNCVMYGLYSVAFLCTRRFPTSPS